MVDLVHLHQQGLHHVMSDEFELRVTKMVHHVLLAAREEVVHHQDLNSNDNHG